MCKISYNIEKICKKLGISYESPYLKDKQFKRDALRLGRLYLKLKHISSDLQEIAERHEIDGLGKQIKKEIYLIENIDHDIAKIAEILRKVESENRKNYS